MPRELPAGTVTCGGRLGAPVAPPRPRDRDRQHAVFAAAEVAIAAAARGNAARAGMIWGAVESEAGLGRVGQWELARDEVEGLVLAASRLAFDQARAEGRLLSLAAAAGVEPIRTG